MNMSCFGLSARITRKLHGRTSPNFCACCLGPWLGPAFALLRCYALPVLGMTSFSHNGPTARHIYSLAAIECEKHNSRDSNQILVKFNDKAKSTHHELRTRGEVCYVRLIVSYLCCWKLNNVRKNSIHHNTV